MLICKHINQPVAELLTQAFTTSRLDMGNPWPQKITSTPTLATTKYCCHIGHPLQEIHADHTYPQTTTLPIEQRIVFKICTLVFKTNRAVSPTYLCNLVETYMPERDNLRSADKLLLVEHKAKHLWGARSFIVSAAKVWNALPNNIRAIGTFKGLECTSRQCQSDRHLQRSGMHFQTILEQSSP